MSLKITGHNRAKRDEIIEAAMGEWDFDGDCIEDRDTDDEKINLGEGYGVLSFRESDDKFVDRVSKAVMQANGGPCVVEVGVICYENAPQEFHTRDQEFWDGLKED